MSKGIKILWAVIGSLFALGIVLTVVGVSQGGTGWAWLDRNGMHFGNRDYNTIEQSDLNSAAFSNVDVKLVEADVELVESTSFGYELVYSGNSEPTVEISGNTLKVIEHESDWHIGIMNLWVFDQYYAKLTIYVPKDAELDSVSLSTASGDTILTGNSVGIGDLTCQSASGGVNLSNLELGQLRLDVASGDVTLSNVGAEDAKFNMASGDLKSTDSRFGTLALDMASGWARVSGVITRDLTINMISGDADFDLIGSEDDYSFSVSRASGDIRVNGRNIADGNLPGSSNYNTGDGRQGRVEIDTASGSVNINFR